ncbi:MAG: 1-acyl-sn-glycerol-3-phosphate acyltransferase [Clostridia bacterium]|nr:1-acyl-sn-glycerol-3-phosphate acyltransferase [Clostridia bacterium]
MFDPKTKKYPYPKDTASHYIILRKNDGTVFDAGYPYIDRSRRMRVKQALTRFLLHAVVFPVARVRMGLRVKGRENLKKHRGELKNGIISCSNHVHFWDFIAVMYGLRPFKPYVVTWAPNVRGENGKMMRVVRCIPIPDNGDMHAVCAMNRAIRQEIEGGGWLHIYVEGSMWEYYRPIRPFKDGAAYYAVNCSRPVLPLAFTYREPGWIRRRVFRQIALLTLNVGEPVYVNEALPREERKEDLTRRLHAEVCRLAGFGQGENIYPPVYNGNERIDYY